MNSVSVKILFFLLTLELANFGLPAKEPKKIDKTKTSEPTSKPEQTNDSDSKNEKKSEKDLEYMFAITETGDRIMIFSDGTWEFAPEPPEAKKIERKVNPEKFTRPEQSSEVLKGKVVDYQINYDKTRWGKLEKPLNENAEYSLIHSDKNAYMIIIPENITIPIENLRNIVFSNAQNASKNAKIVEEEERTVNNSKVVMLRINADIEGMNFVYLYYIYSGDKASIQVIGFTTDELFDEYKKDIEDFLNGFEISQTVKK